MSKVLESLRYSETHEWVKVEGDIAIVGVTDEVVKDEEFGALESVKASSDLISPVSGVVVENNEALEDAPELVNQDPYENWIIKVKMSDPEELNDLISAEEYTKLTEK